MDSGPTPARRRVLLELATLVCARELDHPTRVAVDGITASGKSTLAGELAAAVSGLGRPAVHLTMDDFHNPRALRYRRGRMSAVGYYEDAYDFEALVRVVLRPLGPNGSRRYRRRVLDLGTDRAVADDPVTADPDAVVVVDGTFLQRPEVVDHWDVRLFVDTGAAVALARGVARDAALLGGRAEAEAAYTQRYHAASTIYLQTVRPAAQATVVVGNDDPAHPTIRFPHRPGGAG